jgi:stage III sporulation protein AB
MTMLRLIGAGLIVSACGSFGLGLAAQYRREIGVLRQFIQCVEFIQREMEYHLSPLPDLCRDAGAHSSGVLRKYWEQMALEMESQIAPDVPSCMTAAAEKVSPLPRHTAGAMELLGRSLGSYDLEGQQQALASVHQYCEELLGELEANKTQRIRNYQTLGLCAGAALAILFI